MSWGTGSLSPKNMYAGTGSQTSGASSFGVQPYSYVGQGTGAGQGIGCNARTLGLVGLLLLVLPLAIFLLLGMTKTSAEPNWDNDGQQHQVVVVQPPNHLGLPPDVMVDGHIHSGQSGPMPSDIRLASTTPRRMEAPSQCNGGNLASSTAEWCCSTYGVHCTRRLDALPSAASSGGPALAQGADKDRAPVLV